MQNKIIFQSEESSLNNYFKEKLEENIKKIYFFCSNIKESGFNQIEENLIDKKIQTYFAIGIDKKYTTRIMLELMLQYTENVFVYDNNSAVEFSGNIIILEYLDRVEVINVADNISEETLNSYKVIYTKTTYNLKNEVEKDMYKQNIKELISAVEEIGFTRLNEEKIEYLVNNKLIFSTKQYIHNVKSISELLSSTSKNIANNKNEEETEEINEDGGINDVINSENKIPKVDLSNDDFDTFEIELPEEEIITSQEEKEIEKKEEDTITVDTSNVKDTEIVIKQDKKTKKKKKENEKSKEITENFEEIDTSNLLYDKDLEDLDFDENETLDIEGMLFEKANIKLELDVDKEKEEKNSENKEEVIQTKKIDLNNISNLIIELPKINPDSKDASLIKIPNYINKMIPNFLSLEDKGKAKEINGVKYKIRDIKVEIVNVKTRQKFLDNKANVSIKRGQTYITINSDSLKNINYDENDIVRIIKLSEDTYHIEVISKEIQEYKLWKKLCNQNMKSTTRSYGIM